MRNWKTTLGGIAAIISVVANIVNGHSPTMEDVAIVTTGVGLILAKDHNVTGGTSPQ